MLMCIDGLLAFPETQLSLLSVLRSMFEKQWGCMFPSALVGFFGSERGRVKGIMVFYCPKKF